MSDDWASAPVDARLMGTLEYLHTLTRTPNDVDESTVQAALDAGASAGALEQATLMATLFAYMNRMVDAFGADATPEEAEKIAKVLNTIGGGAELLSREKPWQRLAGEIPGPLVEQIREIREGEGDSPADLRRAIESSVAGRSGATRPPAGELPPAVARLIDTLATDAHGVTDQQIDDLRPDWSEQAIYEIIFVASFAAGLGRLERSLSLLAAH